MSIGGLQPLGLELFGYSRLGDGQEITQLTHTAPLAITYSIGSTTPHVNTGGMDVILGPCRFGDGLRVNLNPKQNAMGLSYTITPSKYAAPLAITYTVQKPNTAPMLLYYLITPPSRFSINGDGSIIRPDQLNYTLRPVVGRTLLGEPILQGFEMMTWSYSVLSWSEFHQLIGHYNPSSPIVTLVFPDKTGTWVSRQAVMHPPTYGDMETVLIYNIAFSFSTLPT